MSGVSTSRGEQSALGHHLVVAGALLFATGADCWATNGYVANGFGLKSTGMGGVAAAVAQEPSGGATNPATMGFLDTRLQASGQWFRPRSSASRSGSGAAGIDGEATSKNINFFIPEVGINLRVSKEIAVGVSIYGNAINSKYPGGQIPAASGCAAFNPSGNRHNLLCGDGNLGVDTPQYIVSPFVAWRFNERHSIGVAPIIAYQRFDLYGLQILANPGLSNDAGSVTNRSHSDSWGVGVRAGYMWQMSDALSIGFAYASRVRMRPFHKYDGLLAESGRMDIPSSFLVGVAFRPDDKWLIAMDYHRINYGDSHALSNPSHRLATCGLQGQRDHCLGGGNGTGLGWRDIDVWKVGVQYDVNRDWTVRAGYSHSESPITSADVTLNIISPGVVKHHYTAGFSYRFGEGVDRDPKRRQEVTVALGYHKKNSVTGESLFVPFGAPSSTTETISMKQYLFGLAYSKPF
jgi:long-chain fatty acid transport protein